jgi:hypothetical protein
VPQRPFGDAQISGHLSDCSPTAHQRDGIVLKLPVVTPTATIPVHGCLLLYHSPARKIEETSRHICAIQYNSENPASLLAWKQELNLAEDQAASLRTIEEKAIGDAKALLTAEQLGKLKELAQNTKSQSMMQCMQGMMHEMKGKMGDAVSMCCSPMHGKAEGGTLAAQSK